MKKMISMLLALVMLVATLPMNAQAAETEEDVTYIYYEDGGYLKITVTQSVSRSHTTINGSKRMERVGANGSLRWEAVLRGNFSYDTTIAICNYATCDVTIYDNIFALDSKNVGKRSNYAYTTFSINVLMTGVVVGTNSYEMTLTCDKNGNLS